MTVTSRPLLARVHPIAGSALPDVSASRAVVVKLFNAVALAWQNDSLGGVAGLFNCCEAFPIKARAGFLGPTDVIVRSYPPRHAQSR